MDREGITVTVIVTKNSVGTQWLSQYNRICHHNEYSIIAKVIYCYWQSVTVILYKLANIVTSWPTFQHFVVLDTYNVMYVYTCQSFSIHSA